MIFQLYMSDFYPSVQMDQKLQEAYGAQIDSDFARTQKEEQFERMVKVQKVIKHYARHEEA